MVLSLKYCDLLNEQFCSAISSGKALLSKLVSFALVCAISFHFTVTVLPVGPRLVILSQNLPFCGRGVCLS